MTASVTTRLRRTRRVAQVGAALASVAASVLIVRVVVTLSKPALPGLGPHQSFRHGRFWSAVPNGWRVEETPDSGGVQFRSSGRADGFVWIQRLHLSDQAVDHWRARSLGTSDRDVRQRLAPLAAMDVLAARSSPPGFIFGGHDPYSTVVRVEVAARGTCADFAIECNVAWEPWQELLSKPSWDETVDWCLGIPPTIRESTPCE